ncbi:sensor histidine kinase [Paenibacillus sp.]|uniref:sensor histidine kinase n=1 Tax=Paenibacillus sp. TaxID=58172 RepID=UPI0028122110|nr:sensor histidine kinase [Paenibacillus sp.]
MKERASLWTYIRNYKFKSIFIKNFMIVLFLLMVPLVCLHYLVFLYNDSTMREEVSRASAGELTRIRDTVDIIMAEAASLGIRLGSDPDVELFLSETIEYPLGYSMISRIRRIQEILGTSMVTNPYVDSIQIYSGDGENEYLLSSTSGGALDKYEHRWWYDEYLAKKGERNFWVSALRKPSRDTIEYNLVLFRKLSMTGANKEGLLTVTISAEQLRPLLKEVTPEQEIYILDRQGNIVFTQEQRLITKPIESRHPHLPLPVFSGTPFSDIIRYEGMDRIVSAAPSSRGEWTYVSIVPLEHYESRQNQLHSFIILLFAIGVGSSFLIAFLISVQTYQPIRGILNLLESSHPPMRDFKSKPSGDGNEIKYIAATILESSEQKKEMEQELRRRYEMMSKAQGIALQAQINPHMLYNTLEAINWKVMRLTNGKNEASVMIHTLSRLLRLSLSTGDNIIPLREELEHARLYVEVQQLHYKDQLEVIWKVNGSILDFLTVKLTLQPIIENAIHHGIKPSGRPGVISIIGYEERESIVLKIKDNGVGLSQAAADKLNQDIQSDEIKEDAHIGLSNVNQRIRLIFGEAYGVRMYGKEGEGTIVELRIPKRT